MRQARSTARLPRFCRFPALGFAIACLFALDLPAASSQETSLYGAYLAGREATVLQDNKVAADFYREALSLDPENEVIMERIFVLDLTTGNVDAAADLASELVKVDSGHKLARLVLATEAIRARQFKSARRHLEQAGDSGPIGDLTKTFLTAWAFQGSGDTDKALELLAEPGASAWHKLYGAFMSGLIADLAGRKDLAAAKLSEAASKDGAGIRISDAYARFMMRNDDWEGASKLVGELQAKMSNNPVVAALRAYVDERKRPEPVVSSAVDGASEALYSIGSALGREGGDDLATAYLRLALQLNPKAEMALLALAETYESQDQHEQAAALFDQVPMDSQLRAHAEIQAAFNLSSANHKDEAVRKLEALLGREPNLPTAIIALGNIEQGRKNWERAAQMFSRAIDLAGGGKKAGWNLYYWRGIAYERAKQWDKAEPDFKMAMEIEPDEPLVLNYLGYSWIDQGINLKEGLDLVKKAVSLKPNDGFIVDSLGWAYYRLGNFDAAARELERAVELRPQDPLINDHLGDAYWKVGRKLEAKFQWNHARDLDPEPEDLARIEKKIAEGLIEAEGAAPPSSAAIDPAKPAPAKNGG